LKRFYLILIFFFTITVSFSQISGVVIDHLKVPISDATVSLYNKANGAVSDYTFSDSLGKFILVKKLAPKDYNLIVSYFGFISDTTLIENGVSRDHTIILKPKDFILSEVVVKAKVVEERGDTLVYSVNLLKDDTDKNVEDVLQRVPGVSIDQGQVKYNGLPINSLNVNGKNLVGGQHQLITKNMEPKDIKDIEVIRSHQPIKILRGNEFNQKATINLNTKKEHLVTTKFHVASGLDVPLWKARGNIMDFSNKYQFIANLSSNNIGENYVQQFREPGIISFGNEGNSLLRLTEAQQQSFINRSYSTFNKESVGGGKFLYSKKNIDVQFGFNANRVSLINQGSEIETKNGQNEVFNFSKTLSTNKIFKDINSLLNITLNSDHIYIASDTRVSSNSNRGLTNNIINNLNVSESHNNLSLNFSNYSTYITKIFGKIIKFRSKLEYNSNEENLTINPSDFIRELIQFSFSKNEQLLSRDKWNAKLYSSILFGKAERKISIDYGYSFEQKKLSSDLFFKDTLMKVMPILNFNNNNKFLSHKLYAKFNAEYRTKKVTLVSNSDLEVASLNLFDLNTNMKQPLQKTERFIIAPDIFVKLRLSNYIEPLFSINYNNRPQVSGYAYINPILSSHRNLQNNSPFILDQSRVGFDFTLPYEDNINLWSVKLLLQGDQNQRKYLNNIFLSGSGESLQIDESNQSKTSSLSYGLKFDIIHFSKKIDFKFQYLRTRISDEFSLNSINTVNLQYTNSAVATLEKRAKKWTAQLTSNGLFFSGQLPDQDFMNLHNLINLKYKFKTNQFASLQYDMVSNFNNNSPQQIHMFDFEYNFLKDKYTFLVKLSNLLNTKKIETFTQNNYIFSRATTLLRPRQIIVECSYRF
jgi:hypothetical protein